jgi:UDP-N-acetylmuramate dehydrogenase
MRPRESVPLGSLTTFRVGGLARYVVECSDIEALQEAFAFAHEHGLPWRVLGGGSNVLASDEGYVGVLIQPLIQGVSYENGEGGSVMVTVGAGVEWDSFVREMGERELWGVENLAGIPGMVGAAPVQNIGAYGADVSQTLSFVEILDTKTGTLRRLTKEKCAFGYRDSIFKHDRSLIITNVGFTLAREGSPMIAYADLKKSTEEGIVADSPLSIGSLVRKIRTEKFPDLTKEGTAGSFFKNLFIPQSRFNELKERFPELPGFPIPGEIVKVPLAWILDHVLHLNGYTLGPVRLFERQPIVIVAQEGATSRDVSRMALEVEKKVYELIEISLEREVQSLG